MDVHNIPFVFYLQYKIKLTVHTLTNRNYLLASLLTYFGFTFSSPEFSSNLFSILAFYTFCIAVLAYLPISGKVKLKFRKLLVLQ